MQGKSTRRTVIRWILLGLLVAALALGAWLLLFRPAPRTPPVAPATPVSAVAVRVTDVPVFIDALGTVIPTRTVTVMTQVNGILTSVDFKEGQFVKQGQVIARIDSRALEAQLAEAQGNLARDQAALANARLDLVRYQNLIKTGSITQQTLDTQAATVREGAGTVQADAGLVKNLQVQVDYCTIRSPVDGVVGLRQVDPGNYVTTTSTTGIAVITQLQPATIVFSVPEDDLGRIRNAMAAGPVAVLAFDRDNQAQLAAGTLLALDNQVDTATGTFKVKAEFPQSGNVLFPNQFVNVRMQASTLRDARVIPTAAIQHGSTGDFVFVVGADSRAILRNVKAGPTQGTDTAILDQGVATGERVVTDGADKIDKGTLLKVVPN